MSEDIIVNHEKRIALIEHINAQTSLTMEAVSGKLDLILAQITRVAILEEKHTTQQVDVTRAHTRIATLESSLNSLSVEAREFINYSKGRDKVLWAIGGGLAMLAIKVLFFAASHGMTP